MINRIGEYFCHFIYIQVNSQLYFFYYTQGREKEVLETAARFAEDRSLNFDHIAFKLVLRVLNKIKVAEGKKLDEQCCGSNPSNIPEYKL